MINIIPFPMGKKQFHEPILGVAVQVIVRNHSCEWQKQGTNIQIYVGIPYTHQKSPIKPYWSPIKPYWRCIIRGFQKCWYPNQSLNISLNHSNSFNWNGELSWSFIQTHHISTFGAFPIQQTSYHHLSSIWVFQDFPLKKKNIHLMSTLD